MSRIENSKVRAPRQRRGDLLAYLKKGDQQKIANMAHCSDSMVSKVLNGTIAQDTDLGVNIIRIAERIAENGRRWKR